MIDGRFTDEEKALISERTRAAMADPAIRARSGRRKGSVPWNKGRTYSDEEKAQMDTSGLALGRTWNKGTKGVMRPNQTSFAKGQTPWNYSGLEVTPNRALRMKGEYKEWRIAVYRRDHFTCQMPGCGFKGRGIEAHHILTVRDHPETAFEVANGVTLCGPCHVTTRGREDEFAAVFGVDGPKRDDPQLSLTFA